MNKNISWIILITIIVLLGAGGYFLLTRENSNRNQATDVSEWKKIEFPENYRHSVNIMYPSNWDVEAAMDTGGFSAHYIYQKTSASILDENRTVSPKGPLIAVYDFVLSGCPDGNVVYWDCGIENVQQMTPEEYMSNLIKNLDKKGEAVGFTSLKRVGSIKLINFIKDTPMYQGVSGSGEPVDFYIIQSTKGVVGVAFQQPETFDASFRTEFFNRLTSN